MSWRGLQALARWPAGCQMIGTRGWNELTTSLQRGGPPCQWPVGPRAKQLGRFYDIVRETAAQYGIAKTANQCAGRAVFGQDPTACAAPETYFYFHDGHPPTTVHRIVARQLEREVKNAFE